MSAASAFAGTSMRTWISMCAFIASASASFCHEAGEDRTQAKDPELKVEIECKQAISFIGEQEKTISTFTKPTIKIFRIDKTGVKRKGLTLRGDSGTAESLPGAGPGKLTLKGNVRVESQDGGVWSTDQAEIDLLEEKYTFKERLMRIPSEK
jgi:hypothetical protein